MCIRDRLMTYIPVFLITSETDPTYLQKGFDLGAVDVITKPFAISFIKRRIENIIELYKHRFSLQQIVNQQVQRIQRQERELYADVYKRQVLDEIRVDTCSNCHPFYTGKQRFASADGRVDKFNKKYGLK